MGPPVSVRLDDDAQEVLVAAARERGIGLSTCLREMAEREAKQDPQGELPKEANKRRLAIVVEDSDLFDAAYPNVILVPLTDDLNFSSTFELSLTMAAEKD
jgi:hypothetical protein